MIRKRMCEKNFIKNTTTHILTGKRFTEHNPPLNLNIGDIAPIKVIYKPGVRNDDTNTEIDPIFTDISHNVKVVHIYEKQFKDLTPEDLHGISDIFQNNVYILSLYLALIYDLTIDEVVNNYVTIVNTESTS